ncbi:hypothetical protein Mapa_003377 [Marchantia paleacea]|nr:hypothetical protein Mapa_003377 [Marchantia paleacea]
MCLARMHLPFLSMLTLENYVISLYRKPCNRALECIVNNLGSLAKVRSEVLNNLGSLAKVRSEVLLTIQIEQVTNRKHPYTLYWKILRVQTYLIGRS